MTKLLTLFTLTFFTLMTCKAQITLKVNIKDCRDNGSFHYLDEFKLYKNGTLIKTVEPKHERKHLIKNLSFGTYKIEYMSMFQKLECIDIEITKNKRYVVDLCINYMDYNSDSYKPFIDRLNESDSYVIQVSSQGCFHNSQEKYLIKRMDDNFYLTFNKKEKLLNKREIDAIRHFEIELNYMNSFGCTTTDTYLIKYKNEKVIISDGSCSWNGIYHLKQELNLLTN